MIRVGDLVRYSNEYLKTFKKMGRKKFLRHRQQIMRVAELDDSNPGRWSRGVYTRHAPVATLDVLDERFSNSMFASDEPRLRLSISWLRFVRRPRPVAATVPGPIPAETLALSQPLNFDPSETLSEILSRMAIPVELMTGGMTGSTGTTGITRAPREFNFDTVVINVRQMTTLGGSIYPAGSVVNVPQSEVIANLNVISRLVSQGKIELGMASKPNNRRSWTRPPEPKSEPEGGRRLNL